MTADLPFPKSLRDFQLLFPGDAACAAYFEKIRWREGFTCPHCGVAGEPYRFNATSKKLACRACKKDVWLMAGTVMERSHSPLSVWFWGAYLVSSHTPGMSARQFQRQLGLSHYETAYQILHKLRAGMVNKERTKIGNQCQHVEVAEIWIGGKRAQGRGRNRKALVVGAVEVCRRKPKGDGAVAKRGGLYAGRLQLSVLPAPTSEHLVSFVESSVEPGTLVTDGRSAYGALTGKGYKHIVPVEGDDEAKVAEEHLPMIHLIFLNLKAWLNGVHHGVSKQHLQAYLNEFTFRFNRRFYPFDSFRSLLGIGAENESATYAELYSGKWKHPNHVAPVED